MSKDTNLIPAITAMVKQRDSYIYSMNRKISEMDEGLKILRRLNTVCEECGGGGWILRSRACAEDDRPDPNDPRDRKVCPICGGSGRARKI